VSKENPIEVRDMAIVHRLFRQAYAEAARLVRAGPTPSPGRVTFLADHIDLVLGGLHSHHQDEDELLYPKLIERVPEQAPMTEEVEHEHEIIKTRWTPHRPRVRPGVSGRRPRPAKRWRHRSTSSTR
jgi:Hemerythrin HHE cation binding domain